MKKFVIFWSNSEKNTHGIIGPFLGKDADDVLDRYGFLGDYIRQTIVEVAKGTDIRTRTERGDIVPWRIRWD